MVTTIQISDKLKKILEMKKFGAKESYEDIIWDLLEDTMELSEETKKAIEQSEKEFKEGKYHTLEDVKKRFKI